MVEPNRININLGQSEDPNKGIRREQVTKADSESSAGSGRKSAVRAQPEVAAVPVNSTWTRKEWWLWGRHASVAPLAAQDSIGSVESRKKCVPAESFTVLTEEGAHPIFERQSVKAAADLTAATARVMDATLQASTDAEKRGTAELGTKENAQSTVYVTAYSDPAMLNNLSPGDTAVQLHVHGTAQSVASETESDASEIPAEDLQTDPPRASWKIHDNELADPSNSTIQLMRSMQGSPLILAANTELDGPIGQEQMQQELAREKGIREAACRALAEMEGNLEALRKRLAAERMLALVDGAPFLVHTTSGPKLQLVWYR